jgi:hypothetical protein
MNRLMILMAVAMVVFSALNSFAADTYEIGMSKQEVIERLGEPVSKHIHGAYERWEYELQGNMREVFYFNYGKLVQMTRWATDSKGRKIREIDILTMAYKKCSIWHILPLTPSYSFLSVLVDDAHHRVFYT